jgi:hypothetical protein
MAWDELSSELQRPSSGGEEPFFTETRLRSYQHQLQSVKGAYAVPCNGQQLLVGFGWHILKAHSTAYHMSGPA